jgi:hypothetical protein
LIRIYIEGDCIISLNEAYEIPFIEGQNNHRSMIKNWGYGGVGTEGLKRAGAK